MTSSEGNVRSRWEGRDGTVAAPPAVPRAEAEKNRPNTCYAFVETVGTLVIIAVTDVYQAKVIGFYRKILAFVSCVY